MIGCTCRVCQSPAPEDKRYRASIVVTQDDGTQVLVDTTPDLRSQALAWQLTRVDAVVYTHSHADHIFGLDELRRFIALRGGGTLTVYGDFNKLLVPTPTPEDADNDGIADYKQYSPIRGIFTSFSDAPGGFSEEMKEITIGTGVEYWYDNQFAVRTGYFYEHYSKGNRKYFSAGIGVKYNVFGLDFSYLIPTTNQRNPLDNTLRFTLTFDFEAFEGEE